MTLAAMLKHAETSESKLFRKHLGDLRFGSKEDAPDGAAVRRGVFVTKRKRSGKSNSSGPCGRKSREDQVSRAVLKRPSAYFEQVKRGRNPEAARPGETARRPPRLAKRREPQMDVAASKGAI